VVNKGEKLIAEIGFGLNRIVLYLTVSSYIDYREKNMNGL